MEGIVSTLVFAILAAAVSMMIMNSMKMSSFATSEARESQRAFNEVMGKANSSLSGTITFSGDVDVEVDVNIYTDSEGIFTAFAP